LLGRVIVKSNPICFFIGLLALPLHGAAFMAFELEDNSQGTVTVEESYSITATFAVDTAPPQLDFEIVGVCSSFDVNQVGGISGTITVGSVTESVDVQCPTTQGEGDAIIPIPAWGQVVEVSVTESLFAQNVDTSGTVSICAESCEYADDGTLDGTPTFWEGYSQGRPTELPEIPEIPEPGTGGLLCTGLLFASRFLRSGRRFNAQAREGSSEEPGSE
jgi:hypothetical protein